MAELSVYELFIIFGAVSLLIGILYAIQIWVAPAPHGYTVISVAVGFSIILLAQLIAVYIVETKGEIWMLYYAIPGAAALLGGPMFIAQVAKKIYEDRENSKLVGDE